VAELLAEACQRGILAGIDLSRWYPQLAGTFLVAVTEKRTRPEIDALVEVSGRHRYVRSSNQTMSSDEKSNDDATAFRTVASGSQQHRAPGAGRAATELQDLLPARQSGPVAPPLPELGEPDVVRHFSNLSTLNMSVDTHFYPLGSCTMKYNPKRNERLSSLPGLVHLHPYQPEQTSQGLLQILFELQQMLGEIAGLPAVSLQPAAGAHGELAALMVAAAISGTPDSGERKYWLPTALMEPIRPVPGWPGSRP
jgi:glycine cleavage system protein P-like pyridoxal-binding family